MYLEMDRKETTSTLATSMVDTRRVTKLNATRADRRTARDSIPSER